METINHECYVSPELAKLLKEAGFDCGYRKYPDSYEEDEYYCYLCLAQRWLREAKDVDIMVRIDYHYGEDYSKAYCSTFYIGDELYTTGHFKTFEEALEAGIKKALDIILEKGE